MNIFASFTFFILVIFSQNSLSKEVKNCIFTDEFREKILQDLVPNSSVIKDLPQCYKLDRELILRSILIDASQFQNADNILKEDEGFVRRLMRINPDILQYASPKLLGDENFMESATYISRDSLKYANPDLLNNHLFVQKMIKIDSRNYIFASERLRSIPEFAKSAFEDDGMLLLYAPESIKSNKELVKIAFLSNNLAIEYAANELKDLPDFKIKSKERVDLKIDDLVSFVRKNYISTQNELKSYKKIDNKAKFFAKNILLERNYITKWQYFGKKDSLKKNDSEFSLIAARSRNYDVDWKEDFKNYPDLITKIERFFGRHKIDQNTINQLSLTYLWKIKTNPLTLAFNLYLLRDNSDYDLGSSFCNISSLTAIVQKIDNKWEMTVIDVIFDSETEVKVSYPNGHKKYVLWDLYKSSKSDKNPKIIFKVEDNFEEYFEIFYEEDKGKYDLLCRVKASEN